MIESCDTRSRVTDRKGKSMSDQAREATRVAVLGTGGWGTAIACHLAGQGVEVTLWGRRPAFVAELDRTRLNATYLPGIPIPGSVRLTGDFSEAVEGAMSIGCVIPTQHIRSTLKGMGDLVPAGVSVVSLSKGIENETLLLPTDILREVFGSERSMGVLVGPSHAEEMAGGLPTTVVVASEDTECARWVQSTYTGGGFRVYTHDDVLGVELGGALKNVVAIASGICDGLGYGDNSKAALLTRGLAEMTRLGVAMGARRETFSGLSGIGDLITTCVSPHGRNRAVGERIGKGETLSQILASTHTVAEGVRTTESVVTLARKHGVEMPITEQVYEVLFGEKDPRRGVQELMLRDLKAEM